MLAPLVGGFVSDGSRAAYRGREEGMSICANARAEDWDVCGAAVVRVS